jgi:divalent metal cation (Fe/Co/Zn/Cd) transporter
VPDELKAARYQLVRSAVAACACSVAWAAVAGVASVAAGAATASVALLAFGLDSVIDGSASAVLVWRFRLELRQAGLPGHGERKAARAVAVAMLAAAAYVVTQAAWALITRAHPRQGVPGIALLAGSVVVLPVLGYISCGWRGSCKARRCGGTAFSVRLVPSWPRRRWPAWPRTGRWAGGRPTRSPRR